MSYNVQQTVFGLAFKPQSARQTANVAADFCGLSRLNAAFTKFGLNTESDAGADVCPARGAGGERGARRGRNIRAVHWQRQFGVDAMTPLSIDHDAGGLRPRKGASMSAAAHLARRKMRCWLAASCGGRQRHLESPTAGRRARTRRDSLPQRPGLDKTTCYEASGHIPTPHLTL
jgi:hypothetical protein